MAASPLLYHAIFNATKEVLFTQNSQKAEGFHSVYDKWLSSQPVMRNMSNLILYPSVVDHLERLGIGEQFQQKEFVRDPHHFRREETSDPGGFLKTYTESAFQELRPHIRPLDMFGSYAPFISMAGIPSIDLSFVKHTMEERLSENDEFEKIAFNRLPYPLLHTQYDKLAAIEKFVDPEYIYHKMATQILAEVARDLCDSLFIPFNVFDYAQLLRDFYIKSNQLHSAIIKEHKSFENGDNSNSELMDQLDMSKCYPKE